jgi:hypothetical protein
MTPLSSITWGASQADLNVTYSFFSEGITVENDGESHTSTNIDPFVSGQILSVFETISQYTNLTFSAATGATDFQIMLTNDLGEDTDGFMNPPAETNAGLGIFKAVPDALFEIGAYNYMVVVHEVMHGLGLAHPHDDGGGSDILTGVTEAFDDYGEFDLNQGVYTVMTYNNGFPLGDPAPDSKEYGYETGPMALDVAVLQAKYGTNATWASSDNAYEIVGTNAVGTGWTTIWDTAGTDTISYDGPSNVTIDLRPATLEYEVGGGGFASSVEGVAGGYTIANGVTIENATGGSGNDMLTGNALANVLDGGAGTDTAVYAGNQNTYTLTLNKTGNTLSDRSAADSGADTLLNMEFLSFDTGLSGNTFDLTKFAGTEDLTEDQMHSFVELYIAYFNRAPDAVGLNFWGTAFSTGTTLEQMATLFIDQDETRATYDASLSNADFVTAVYANVLGRVGDQAGIDFWLGNLENGSVGRDQFILGVLEGAKSPIDNATAEQAAQQAVDQKYLSDKTDIGAHFAITKGLSTVSEASAALALFDGTQASITNAVSAIDEYFATASAADSGQFLMPLVGVLDDSFEMSMVA